MGLGRHLGLFISHLPTVSLKVDVHSADPMAAAAMGPSPFPPPTPPSKYALAPFRPSIAVIVGVLTTMFSLTFLLLLYAKHCKRGGESGGGYSGERARSGLPTSWGERRNSGVERAVVELLPVFRFSSLLGQKEGLECAVCLSRFEPTEVLRLLPKCRHAFHVECVDVWLDAHSTCPLCRVRVDPEDVLLLPPNPRSEPGPIPEPSSEKPPESRTSDPVGRRVSGRHSSAGEKSSHQLQFVAHKAEPPKPRSRRSVDSLPLRCSTEPRVRKDGLLLFEDRERFEHRIVVSNSETIQDRWSDLRPSDLLFLRSEMIITDSGRFSASRIGRPSGYSSSAGGRAVINARSLSEITGVSRFPPSASSGAHRRAEEERTMRRWLGFAARRTARWLRGANEDSGT